MLEYPAGCGNTEVVPRCDAATRYVPAMLTRTLAVLAFSYLAACHPRENGTRPPSSTPTVSPATPAGGVLADFTITRGQSVRLPGGATLQFQRHGHKDVTPEMGPSPLLVGGTWTAPGGTAKEFWVLVQLEQSRRFTIEGEELELVDHVYNESMHLRYFGRMP